MRYRFLFLLVSVLAAWPLVRAAAQAPDTAALASHRTVAVLPFEVTLDGLRLRYLPYYMGTDSTAATQQKLSAEQQQEARQVAYQMQQGVADSLSSNSPSTATGCSFSRWPKPTSACKRLASATKRC
jgi:hypothetical protein